MERKLSSMMAGVAGAGALTLVHQAARLVTPQAPRMDVLGMRALRGAYRRLGVGPRSDRELERDALAGDLIANSAFYSLVGAGSRESVWIRGLGLGLAAGLGALLLPKPLGLGDPPNAHQAGTQVMTMAWYVLGGMVAAATFAAGDREASEPVRVAARSRGSSNRPPA
jgi:hypothetical protein